MLVNYFIDSLYYQQLENVGNNSLNPQIINFESDLKQ